MKLQLQEHLDWQEVLLMSKKVILFIVEGTTDKSALSGIFSKIIQSEKIKFLVMRGDITSKEGITRTNIEKELSEKILKQLDIEKYEVEDLLEIVHLCDTDGAYVGVDFIKQRDDLEKPSYTEECIKARNIGNIERRNDRKKNNLERLSGISRKNNGTNNLMLKKIKVPYKLYYFSCNLEHVLHNRLEDFSDKEKRELSEKFEDLYIDDIDGFKAFIKNVLPPSEYRTYRKTWLFIGKSTNSLKRYSNLHFFLEEK